jgi:hypothetical protein
MNSKTMVPIEGTPDSFLVLNVLENPDETLEYLRTQLTEEHDKLIRGSKPSSMFYSKKSDDTVSLAYLRCPSIKDVKEFTEEIKKLATSIDPNVNIVKIVRYKDGQTCMKAHADKTIDLDDNVPIYNIRLGSPRQFVLTHKVTGTQIITVVPNGAMFVLGLKTNSEYVHRVPSDDTSDCTYSIVLRKSVTFKDSATNYLWGPRTLFPLYKDLQEYVSKLGTNTESTNDKSELVKLWHLENKCTVGPEHYSQYNSERVSKTV